MAPQSVRRFKSRVRDKFRRGRGRNLRCLLAELKPLLVGWVSYFRKSQVKQTFEDLDGWLRRKLRVILWRQWKRPRTRVKELMRRDIDQARAWQSAMNGHGPWWNAGASHMNQAVPTRYLHALGLTSLLAMLQKFGVSN